MTRLFTSILVLVLGIVPLARGQTVEDLQEQLDEFVTELEENKDLIRQLRRTIAEMKEGHQAEVQNLQATLTQIQEQMGSVVPSYVTQDEDEFDEKIRRILDDRFRDYTRVRDPRYGTGFLKGEPGEDTMVERINKSFNYLTIGAEMTTAGQVFSGLDPFDDRPDLQRVLNLTRLSLRWQPSDSFSGLVEGQWFGNWGTSDTRFEDYYLVTPRTGSARDLPIELVQPEDISMPMLDPLVLEPRASNIPNDVFQLYQAHFDIKNIFDLPMGVRVGRQELGLGEKGTYGNEFLYGNNDQGDLFFGQSFDGVKVMMANAKEDPKLLLDMWWYKPDELEETAFLEDDSSPDFYGVYGSYRGLAGNELLGKIGLDIQQFDMGWTLIRNPGTDELQQPSPLPFGMRNTYFGTPLWREDPAQRFIDRTFADVRFHESDEMMTLSWYMKVKAGERVTADLNFAYQYGDTAEKSLNSGLTVISPFDGFPINEGDITLASGDYDSVAGDAFVDIDLSDTMVDAHISETTSLRPHVGVGYAFFRGSNLNDFLSGDMKTFQRIAADRQYGEIMDRAPFGSFLSNSHILQAKLGLTLSESLAAEATWYSYWVDQPEDPNGPYFGANPDIFGLRESIIADLTAFQQPGDPDPTTVISPVSAMMRDPRRHLGNELDILFTYHPKSSPMHVFVGWNHFFDGAYFQDVLPDTNTFMHQLFGDEFGRQFDVKGGEGQDYFFVQVKLDF